jgi:hypothetical protein
MVLAFSSEPELSYKRDVAPDPAGALQLKPQQQEAIMQTQQGLFVPYWEPTYLENQWAEDTLVAFEREHGEGEHIRNLAGILAHFAKWCDANGLG